ncbi:MAG: GAF domain-containing protein [Nitratireductor sp.]
MDMPLQTGNDLGWDEVSGRIAALIEGEDDDIAVMATIACELHHAFERFHWTGFYRNAGNRVLKIGPYQGGHGCLVIPFERGVCGACATRGETLIVDDVEAFPDHIACSSTTRSEIVVPVWKAGELLAVLDIDSDHVAAFDDRDRVALEAILATAFNR